MSQKVKTKNNIKRISITSIIFVVGSWLATYFWVYNFGGFTIKNAAELGDAFGGLNTLFSGLAFIGVIYAILLQQEELGLQRQELEETRKELKKAAEAQKEQVDNQIIGARLQALNSLYESSNGSAKAEYLSDIEDILERLNSNEIYNSYKVEATYKLCKVLHLTHFGNYNLEEHMSKYKVSLKDVLRLKRRLTLEHRDYDDDLRKIFDSKIEQIKEDIEEEKMHEAHYQHMLEYYETPEGRKEYEEEMQQQWLEEEARFNYEQKSKDERKKLRNQSKDDKE